MNGYRIVFFVQPENQFFRQCNVLKECIVLIRSMNTGVSEMEITVVGLHDETVTHMLRLLETLEVERKVVFEFQAVPTINNLFESKFDLKINKNDMFLFSGTKLQQSWYLAQWSKIALQLNGPLTIIHEQANGLEMETIVVNEDRNGQCSAELSTSKRIWGLDLTQFMTDKGYKFVRYNPKPLSENEKRLRVIELGDGFGKNKGINALDGFDFEIVIADALHQSNLVDSVLINVELRNPDNTVAREEDIACGLKCGIYLFLSCKFGKGIGDSKNLEKELKRLSDIAVSRNLQPKERWRVGLVLRKSLVSKAREMCESQDYKVLILSLSNLNEVVESINNP